MKKGLPETAILVLAALGYFLAAQLGLSIGGADAHAAPVWPPSGIALAAMLIWGTRLWPGVMLGAFLTALLNTTTGGRSFSMVLIAALGIALGAGLEGLAGTWLTQRFARGRRAFEQPQTFLTFVALAAVLCTLIGASYGVGFLGATGLRTWSSLLNVWFTWWLGDMVSIIVLTPLIVSWASGWKEGENGRIWEFAVLLAVLCLVCEFVFGAWVSQHTQQSTPLSFLTIPVLVWAALRFGLPGTTAASFVLACLAILGTTRSHGPFADVNLTSALLMLQNYIAVVTVLALVLAADVKQRKGVEESLRGSEHRYRSLFESSPMPLWVHDCDTLQILAVNEAAIRHYGYTRDEFLQMRVSDLQVPGSEPDAAKESRTEGRISFPKRHRKKNGAVIEVEVLHHSIAFDDHRAAVVLTIDMTERNLAERRVVSFSDLGRRLSAARTPREAAQIIADTANSLLGWDACVMDLRARDHKTFRIVYSAHIVDGRRIETEPQADQAGPLTRETLTNGPQLIALKPGWTLPENHPAFRGLSRPTSVMAAPLRRDEEILGVFFVLSCRATPYTEEDLRTLQALADHCGGALERIRAEADLQAHQGEILRLNAELEARVQDRTAQLEAINKELEAFAYSVSHDLRAPLRSIRGFSEVLLQRFGSQVEDRGKDLLRRICDSSHHMDRLIEDLLKFSRLSRAELRRDAVNLSALAESVATELRKSDPDRRVEVAIAPDLQVKGDERLLRVVLDNLLRNAWKFTGKEPKARIEIGAASEPPNTYFVRDNGAGFDMTYAGKLFGVFQRLHTASEFPGTGIGLATVQRIINRHGGRVWATGSINQGATFYFTLPNGG